MAQDREEADRRLEAAQQAAQREKETAEFLRGLTSNDELLKPIYNPEAWVIRDQARAKARRGELPTTKCGHPMAYLQQYVDDDAAVGRNGTPLNLFECGICHMPIWLTDPWGTPITDN